MRRTRWSSRIGGLVVPLKGAVNGVIWSYLSALPPCASVSFSPLCPPCSGSPGGGTRSRRWCAEAVGKHTEKRGVNCHTHTSHNSLLLSRDDMSVTAFRNPVVFKLKPLYEDFDQYTFVSDFIIISCMCSCCSNQYFFINNGPTEKYCPDSAVLPSVL